MRILNYEHLDIKIRAYFAIGFFTGMRTGEITGLKWSDIDLEAKTIKVQRTRNKAIESTPKTHSSIREVEIMDVLFPYIEKHYRLFSHQEYVFQTKNALPFNGSSQVARTYWVPTLKDLTLEHRNLYQMRHTFASMMIASGEDILWVSNMLGHKNSSITLQVYAKYIKNDKKQRGTFLLN
ncbi:MAG: tyrosine-type recombinase/integrase [Helicobacteraceae bacterium]|nr:tyrosine-type recombinase/integrase [Helicobacteraceae bacterium]